MLPMCGFKELFGRIRDFFKPLLGNSMGPSRSNLLLLNVLDAFCDILRLLFCVFLRNNRVIFVQWWRREAPRSLLPSAALALSSARCYNMNEHKVPSSGLPFSFMLLLLWLLLLLLPVKKDFFSFPLCTCRISLLTQSTQPLATTKIKNI